MNVLINAFIHGLLVGAIIASVAVVITLIYQKVKGVQNTDH